LSKKYLQILNFADLYFPPLAMCPHAFSYQYLLVLNWSEYKSARRNQAEPAESNENQKMGHSGGAAGEGDEMIKYLNKRRLAGPSAQSRAETRRAASAVSQSVSFYFRIGLKLCFYGRFDYLAYTGAHTQPAYSP
jgi:hypothetical protein